METTPEFNIALQNWLDAVKTQILDKQVNADWQKNHGVGDYYTLTTEDGQKFIRIVSVSPGSRSAWAFVAMADGETKGLGKWKQGDIFKPASWKIPARHARGNIFDTSNGATCNITQWTGPNYLR